MGTRHAEELEARPTPQRIEELETEFSHAAIESHRRLYPAVRAEALEIGGGVAAFVGDLPLTRVLGLGMRGPVDEDTFARLESFYAERGVKTTIDLCPYADPSVLELLSCRGYRAAGWKQLLLRSVGAEDRLPAHPQSGIAVMHAGPSDIETWTRVVAQGFLEGEEVDDKNRELYTTLFHASKNTTWLATVDGVPAAEHVSRCTANWPLWPPLPSFPNFAGAACSPL